MLLLLFEKVLIILLFSLRARTLLIRAIGLSPTEGTICFTLPHLFQSLNVLLVLGNHRLGQFIVSKILRYSLLLRMVPLFGVRLCWICLTMNLMAGTWVLSSSLLDNLLLDQTLWVISCLVGGNMSCTSRNIRLLLYLLVVVDCIARSLAAN